MSLSLDSAIEERIQRELARGPYREPGEVVAHALDLLDAERDDFEKRRARLLAWIEESFAQADRGETYSPEEARAELERAGSLAGSDVLSPYTVCTRRSWFPAL